MRVRLILVLISVIFFAAACAPEPQILSDQLLQDESLITEDPCGPPCWRGITPGETSWNDALDIIEQDLALEDLQTRANEETGQIGASWAQVDGDNCCQMFTQDGTTVSLLVAQTTPELTFDQIVDEYGQPSYIIGDTVTSDQALVSVYYPDVPMLIYLFVAGESGEINGSNPVVGFAYMTGDLMELLLSTSELHTWEGYGTFASYIDSEFEVTPSVTLTPADNGE
ncbi:MAG: hypothetical protein ACOCX5_02400 [Chloroflexota bacterium]